MSSQMGQFRSSLKNAWRNDRRQLLRSATAWFLFGAIIVVFVFWGLTPQQAGVTRGGQQHKLMAKSSRWLSFRSGLKS